MDHTLKRFICIYAFFILPLALVGSWTAHDWAILWGAFGGLTITSIAIIIANGGWRERY